MDIDDALELARRILAAERDQAEQMYAALLTSSRVGIATGIVMMTEGLDLAQAFQILQTSSTRSSRSLTEVAEDVIRLRHLMDNGSPSGSHDAEAGSTDTGTTTS